MADAQVVIYAPPRVNGKENAAEARTTTDAHGQFHLRIPALGRMLANGVNFLAYRPGLALSANGNSRMGGSTSSRRKWPSQSLIVTRKKRRRWPSRSLIPPGAPRL